MKLHLFLALFLAVGLVAANQDNQDRTGPQAEERSAVDNPALNGLSVDLDEDVAVDAADNLLANFDDDDSEDRSRKRRKNIR